MSLLHPLTTGAVQRPAALRDHQLAARRSDGVTEPGGGSDRLPDRGDR